MSIDITVFRLIALFISFFASLYLLRLVYLRKIRGFEFILWFTLTLTVFTLSIFPAIIILIFHYLTLSIINRYDRLVGLSFIFIFFSFTVIFYYRNRLHTFRKQFLDIVQVNAARQFIDNHTEEKGKFEIFVLIPAFNEGENLG